MVRGTATVYRLVVVVDVYLSACRYKVRVYRLPGGRVQVLCIVEPAHVGPGLHKTPAIQCDVFLHQDMRQREAGCICRDNGRICQVGGFGGGGGNPAGRGTVRVVTRPPVEVAADGTHVSGQSRSWITVSQ